MKQTIRLTESQFKKVITETVKNVIKEREDIGMKGLQPKNYVPSDSETMRHYKADLRDNIKSMMRKATFGVRSGWLETNKEQYIKLIGETKFYDVLDGVKQAEILNNEITLILNNVYEKIKYDITVS